MFFRKSPLTPLCQRGEFLPFLKGGKEGFVLQCPYNYGPISNLRNHFLKSVSNLCNHESVEYFFGALIL